MIDHGERKLEDLLSSRHVEPASADLSQRIILKARALPQKKTLPLWRLVGGYRLQHASADEPNVR